MKGYPEQKKVYVMIGSQDEPIRFVKFDNQENANNAIVKSHSIITSNNEIMYSIRELQYTSISSSIEAMRAFINAFIEGFSVGRQSIYPDDILPMFERALFVTCCTFITYGNPWIEECIEEMPTSLEDYVQKIEARKIEVEKKRNEQRI